MIQDIKMVQDINPSIGCCRDMKQQITLLDVTCH